MDTERQATLKALGVGLVLACLAPLTFVSAYALNFIATLAHEMGHAAVSTFGGAPAFPAIRLTGEACTCSRDQYTWLALAIWAFLAWIAWECRHRERRRSIVFAIVALLYPLFAFTGLFGLLVLLAGHGGELAFAGLCFWRAWTGGFTPSLAERIAYALCAWNIAGANLWFHLQLLLSSQYRHRYQNNGSFGLVNDYIRVAEDVLGWRLESVALVMLLLNVLVLPSLVLLGVWIWHGGGRRAPT